MRKLLNGKKVPEFEEAVDLTIHTKCPEKWVLVDLETGQQYTGAKEPNLYGKWKRLDEKVNLKDCFNIDNISFDDISKLNKGTYRLFNDIDIKNGYARFTGFQEDGAFSVNQKIIGNNFHTGVLFKINGDLENHAAILDIDFLKLSDKEYFRDNYISVTVHEKDKFAVNVSCGDRSLSNARIVNKKFDKDWHFLSVFYQQNRVHVLLDYKIIYIVDHKFDFDSIDINLSANNMKNKKSILNKKKNVFVKELLVAHGGLWL